MSPEEIARKAIENIDDKKGPVKRIYNEIVRIVNEERAERDRYKELLIKLVKEGNQIEWPCRPTKFEKILNEASEILEKK